jgi:signal transduction histidine kinase
VSTIQAAVRGDTSAAQRREIEIQRAGERRTVGLTVHPLRRDDGKVRGSLILFADLTETRKRAEEERLGASLAQLGELSAGLAHEQRNSLATLRGYLTLIERAPDEESITDYLEEIRRESDHLQRVLEDFLSFARPGSVRHEEVDLAAIARRAALDPALDGFEVEVISEAGEDAAIKGDAQLLERAVRNLLHNAAEAERGAGLEGPLRVRLEASADGPTLSIEDRGPGLPAEVRERLFQPFATGRAGGVGLGLALARRIVDLHGGRLTLEDRGEGGTRATISIPAVS